MVKMIHETTPPARGRAGAESRRSRKKSATRARLRKAAWSLFLEKGCEAASVDEIVARADVAKGTFFNYFSSKDGVLADYEARFAETARAEAAAILSGDPGARAFLEAYFSRLAAIAENDRERFAIYVRGLIGRPALTRAHQELREEQLALFESVLGRDAEAGVLRPDADRRVAAETVAAMWTASALHWVASGARAGGLSSAVRARIALVFEGLERR